MAFTRMIFSLPVAAGVVLLLFALMTGLIRQDYSLAPAKAPLKLTVTPQIEPTKPPKQVIDETSSKVEPPPVIPTTWEKHPTAPTAPVAPAPKTIDPATGPIGGSGIVIQPPPAYPKACADRGIEGVVLVQFDVTPEGSVANVRIISSPHRCFDRAVIRAVSGWKYPPAYNDGRPAARYGVTERISFELE